MRLMFRLLVLSAALATSGSTVMARADVRVVATTPTLASLVRDVGGDRVAIDSLAQPNQDPHFVDGRPSFVVALNRADLLVHIGLGLEGGWLPPLVANARNADIQPGRPGNLDASTVAGPLLEGGGGDRRMGDVHPGGNPHYLYDPRYGVRVAHGIAERLAQIDPEHASDYRESARGFEEAMERRIAAWETKMQPHRGKDVVGFHKSLVYLTEWLGLERAGFIEPLPGISPTPRHIARLILDMRRNGVGAVVSEPWYNAETARIVASRAGAKLVRLPGSVGTGGLESYADLVDEIVRLLEEALR